MELNINRVLEAVNDKIEKLESDLMFAKYRNEDLENENKRMKKTIEDLNGKIKEFEIGKGLD